MAQDTSSEGILSPDLRRLLVEGAATLKVALDDAATDRFALYLRELLSWTQKHNLTAIRAPREVVTLHFLDSLTCVAGYDFASNRPVMDVGTGAGFPGLPLKIAYPDLPLTMLDSSIKKVEFLQHLCPLLGFKDVDIAHARAEQFGHVGAYRGKFAVVVSRAVAPLPTLIEFCLPFAAVGGYFLAQKNLELGEELVLGGRAASALGGGEPVSIPVTTPGAEVRRQIISIRKENPTPGVFPRRPGVPAKRPLGNTDAPFVHEKYR